LKTAFLLLQLFAASQYITFNAPTPGVIAAILATLLLLMASALISGSEVAYFSLKPQDINILRSQETKSHVLTLRHLEKPELLLATILIVNNFVNVGIVMLSAFITTQLITFVHGAMVKFIFEVIFITSIILFFGEILPKVYAGQFPRRFSSLMAYPLLTVIRLCKPVSMLLVRSSNVVNRRMSHKTKGLSLNDISEALELTGDEIFEEREILKSIVTFGNIEVNEIMTARVDVVDLDLKSNYNKVLAVIVESGYSRIPVYDQTPDNVKGILYVKDLLPHLNKDKDFQWQNLIRPVYYVPGNKRINALLAEFQAEQTHMAIVVDEYGGTAGIVTLEDILEEIVGEIVDEMDDEEQYFSIQPDGSYAFEGKTQLKDFFRITGINDNTFDKVKGEAETLAGLILELRGVIPEKHEIIDIGKYQFTILSADKRRIKKIKFTPPKAE
jgi:gliding motility-associated protein GldE